MTGITYYEGFIDKPHELFKYLVSSVNWDERMGTRKTASYGKAYNYSQMAYPFQEFLPVLSDINKRLSFIIGFTPNNCLINYYPDGKSKMGYHADQTDILKENTGIAIVSIGEARKLKFRNKMNPETILEYELQPGSLIYMAQEIQDVWEHAIPKSDTENGRISLTFRNIK
ncbi:alpha-ketoglutarate-dependent dioxygenase AlkB [Flavitalea flava]